MVQLLWNIRSAISRKLQGLNTWKVMECITLHIDKDHLQCVLRTTGPRFLLNIGQETHSISLHHLEIIDLKYIQDEIEKNSKVLQMKEPFSEEEYPCKYLYLLEANNYKWFVEMAI